jgi:hypothetical protein
VIQRRVKSRSRTIHRGVTGPAAVCTTTQNPPPQHPVPPTTPTPVSVYLHRNAQKSMERNQTLQAVSVVIKHVLLIQVYSVSNQAMVQEVVIKLHIQLHIHKLKVVHVVRYREEVVLRIKQRARLRQIILVSVRQRRLKGRGRLIHSGASGTTVAVCTTTQNPPPQYPVPPPDPVSVYLHQNVHESMEMNQTVQAVSVVIKDVLLLVRIATQMVIYAVILLLQYAVKQMVLQPTVPPVSVGQMNVLMIPVSIVTNLSILAQLCVATSMVLLLIQNNAHVDQPGVLLMLAFIALLLPAPVRHDLLQPVLSQLE